MSPILAPLSRKMLVNSGPRRAPDAPLVVWLRIVTIIKPGLLLPGLTRVALASIVRRLEHGAFLVLTCGGALLVEAGRGINVIVA